MRKYTTNSITKPQPCTVDALLTELKACSTKKDLKWGERVHAKAVHSCKESNKHVATALIRMYAKCGSMVNAHRVFDCIHEPNVVAWTSLLLGYAENGKGHVSLDLFSKMKACGCTPDPVSYVAALKACSAMATSGWKREECLEQGRMIHYEVGSNLDLYVQNALIYMYAKCNSMVEAHLVFKNVKHPDVVSWNALIVGYAEHGHGLVALDFFTKMTAHGATPNCITYVASLKACASAGTNGEKERFLQLGRVIHSEIGCHLSQNHYLQNTLIDMYSKCGSMLEAESVFETIQFPGLVAWNALIQGYVENGKGRIALNMFFRMKAQGCVPSPVTYIAALKACGLIGALALGRKIHGDISEFTGRVVTCLIDFYAKCGSMSEGREVFDLHLKVRDVTTWTALLAGYAKFGDASVFRLFKEMQDEGLRPDAACFMCLLLCCSHGGLVEKAWEYLEAMPRSYGITPSVRHYTCMVDVLGRANQLNEAVAMLRKMVCNPDAVTWTGLLCACRKWKNVEVGRIAFQSLVDMSTKDASCYELMANIYGSRGMWEEQERVLDTKINLKHLKLSEQASEIG